MNRQVRLLFVMVVIFLVIAACFIDPVDAKKKKKKAAKETKGKASTKVESEPTYTVRTGSGPDSAEDDIDPETMAKIQARIKEKGYEKLIRDHQVGKIKDDDPIYKDMLDDLVKQTVKIELTPMGTEIIEERPLTPEEIEIEERRQAEEDRLSGKKPYLKDEL